MSDSDLLKKAINARAKVYSVKKRARVENFPINCELVTARPKGGTSSLVESFGRWLYQLFECVLNGNRLCLTKKSRKSFQVDVRKSSWRRKQSWPSGSRSLFKLFSLFLHATTSPRSLYENTDSSETSTGKLNKQHKFHAHSKVFERCASEIK